MDNTVWDGHQFIEFKRHSPSRRAEHKFRNIEEASRFLRSLPRDSGVMHVFRHVLHQSGAVVNLARLSDDEVVSHLAGQIATGNVCVVVASRTVFPRPGLMNVLSGKTINEQKLADALREYGGPTEKPEKKDTPTNPYDLTSWPPPKPPPKSKSPKVGALYAAEYRYQRYRYDSFTDGKKKEEVLDFETYKERHYKTVLKGGRPGRKGGKDQVRVRKLLETQENFTDTEKIPLGGRYIDLFKKNELGGIDYIEVDEILKRDGIPKAALRDRLKEELPALKKNDRLIYVDKTDPAKRITYYYGDDPSVVDTRKWNQ